MSMTNLNLNVKKNESQPEQPEQPRQIEQQPKQVIKKLEYTMS